MTQGLLIYPGLAHAKSARYSQGYGASHPDVIHVTCIPQNAGTLQARGTAQFVFGTNTVTLFDCAVDYASIELTTSGHVMRLKLLDFRWASRFGEINGLYNAILPDNTLDPDLERTPQQLATLLGDAMGLTSFDVTALPDDARPLVNWVCANPASELDRLCDLLGCRFAPGHSGIPHRIVKVGSRLSTPQR